MNRLWGKGLFTVSYSGRNSAHVPCWHPGREVRCLVADSHCSSDSPVLADAVAGTHLQLLEVFCKVLEVWGFSVVF